MQKSGKGNSQVQHTKSWIFEALMLLTEEKTYGKITVSDITEKAGVTRTTFYHYYDDIDDVVGKFLRNAFTIDLANRNKSGKNEDQNIITLVFDDRYIQKYQKNLKKIISAADIESRIFRHLQKLSIPLIRRSTENLEPEESLAYRHKIFYQLAGSLKVIFDWYANSMPIPAEGIISMLNSMNEAETAQYGRIPGIAVRLKEKPMLFRQKILYEKIMAAR